MATASKLLTYEEWLQMPPVEDGTDEVVKGEYRFMPPTRYPHAEIIRRLIKRLDPQLDEAEVTILGSNFGLMISREPLTCRVPDAGLYWLAHVVIEDGLYCSAPNLVVEVLSPSENHRRKAEKLDDYASIGVPEAWVFSPQAKSVEVYLLRDGRLERTAVVVDGELRPTRFPAVTIQVPDVWPK